MSISFFLPAAVRLVLPMEDPYSGQGSPMASIIGVFVLGLIGLPFAFLSLVSLFITMNRTKR